MFGCLARLLLVLVGLVSVVPDIFAHDHWIMRGGHRNAAGEWCCGEGDCFMIPAERVTRARDGSYRIWSGPAAAFGLPQSQAVEVVPEAEAQPSPDGAYWRCKRPDGTRRCFFAPPPNT